MSNRNVFMVSPSALTVNLGETFDPFLALNGNSFILKNIAKGHNRPEFLSQFLTQTLLKFKFH